MRSDVLINLTLSSFQFKKIIKDIWRIVVYKSKNDGIFQECQASLFYYF